MNVSIVADAPFGDNGAFLDFLGVHEVAHQTIANRLATIGASVNSVPLADTPLENHDWLLDHYQIHLDIDSTLKIGVPDLSSVDLTKEDQYFDWMQVHAQVHEQINLSLGIAT